MTVSTLTRPNRVTGPALSATLCGSLNISAGGVSLGARQLGGAKPRHILVALLLQPGQPVAKRHLITLLWGQDAPPGAAATLETYVSVLRKKLDGLNPGRHGVIKTVPGGYVLDASLVQVDTDRFQTLAAEARAPGLPAPSAVAGFCAALASVGGVLLPEEKALAWIDEERAAHEDRVTRALADGASAALVADELELAERWARLVLKRNEFDESAWRVLLESLERRGQHADGVRAYDTCRRLFAEELGCAPGPGIRATFTRLLAGTNETTGDGVAPLVEAVVRLHHEVSSTMTDGESLGSATLSGLGAIEEACRLLDQLLTSVRIQAAAGYRTPISA